MIVKKVIMIRPCELASVRVSVRSLKPLVLPTDSPLAYRGKSGVLFIPALVFKRAMNEAMSPRLRTSFTVEPAEVSLGVRKYRTVTLAVVVGDRAQHTDLPCVERWKATLTVRYLRHAVTAETLVQALHWAGSWMGIGCWRLNGEYGRFRVA